MESKQRHAPRSSNSPSPTRIEDIQSCLDDMVGAGELHDATSLRLTIWLGPGIDLHHTACSEADWDNAALEFEYVFNRRFGVDWPRADRASLLACKQKYQLTDEEIRTLLRARGIHRRRDEASLAVNAWLPIAGYCHITILVILLVPLALSVLWIRPLPSVQVLVAMGCGLVLGGMMRVVYHTHLVPWKIFQRATNWARL